MKPIEDPGYSVERIKHLFDTHQLPKEVREKFLALKKSFEDLCLLVVEVVPSCPHRTIAINKLIEAKDAACLGLITESISEDS